MISAVVLNLTLCGRINGRMISRSLMTVPSCGLDVWVSSLPIHFIETEQANGRSGSSPFEHDRIFLY